MPSLWVGVGEKKEKEATRGLNVSGWMILAALLGPDSALYRLIPCYSSGQLFLSLHAPNVLILGTLRQLEGSLQDCDFPLSGMR